MTLHRRSFLNASAGMVTATALAAAAKFGQAAADQPLPMVRDPRVVFDTLFGVGATPGERRERRVEDKSLLDWLSSSVASCAGVDA